jgi:GDP-L-fucose synthase
MRIFLTGGRGMVGKNFSEHSAAKAHEILAPTSQELDLRNFDSVLNWIESIKPDIIVHCAGRVGGIQANISNPVAYLVDNLDIGRNVIGAARKFGVRNLLNLGTSCMYPKNTENPLREEMILTGELEHTNEGYALAKITAAKLCEFIGRENPSFYYKTIVPCNIYGRYDKFDPLLSHLVPAIIHKIHLAKTKGDREVDIWGTGNARREFLYAGDLADFMWFALENFEALPSLMNVGIGADLSILDYYRAVAGVIGYSGDFVFDLSKPEGMPQKLVSIDKLKNWGWKSTTSLEEGIAKTYEFYLDTFKA